MISWNPLIAHFPGAHVLQTTEWGTIKARYGWQPNYLLWFRPGGSEEITFSHWSPEKAQAGADLPSSTEVAAAALCLIRPVQLGGMTLPLSIAYVPKGPLLDWGDAALRARVLADLPRFANNRGALFLKVDPDVPLGVGEPGTPAAETNPIGVSVQKDLRTHGWVYSAEQIQFRNTVHIHLAEDEDSLLAKMKQKTRYNIRLAGRKGVTVRVGGMDDLETLYQLYAETAVRDGFVIRDKDYYHSLWKIFMESGPFDDPRQPSARPLIAEVAGQPVAAVVIFRFASTAWFLYGMSSEMHREKMPNYLLQWEAIKSTKSAGCKIYDMWGAPETFSPDDPLWGVYRFKDGFQGTVARSLGAWDLPLKPTLHRLYSSTLPRILALMRRRGKARAQGTIKRI